jgi:hypothetical protein
VSYTPRVGCGISCLGRELVSSCQYRAMWGHFAEEPGGVHCDSVMCYVYLLSVPAVCCVRLRRVRDRPFGD